MKKLDGKNGNHHSNKQRKLILSRETLRVLSPSHLTPAVGGIQAGDDRPSWWTVTRQ
jgi:hypothetical protein